ncbi:MAG TPA: class I SAM-dependent methyltransferase, partial [Aestuariivirgaceae bacterium]|nr:class I SAM-dependent methyltransferase [Aestuariivirgaceae bacterium]
EAGGEIYRTVSRRAAEDYGYVRDSGLLDELMAEGKLVASEEVDHRVLKEAGIETAMVLRHQRIPFISYPYEWPFSLLKSAALLHLDIHIEALQRGVTLSDASAYNVQFRGIKPLFIDVLSFRRYRDGEVWAGYRQFCEQFLNPLLLRSLFGVAHNAWYRGRLEGIETSDLADIMPWWRNLSFNVLSHVTLQARLQRAASAGKGDHVERAKRAKLSKRSYVAMLEQLRHWIDGLKPLKSSATTWQNYAENTTYGDEEREAKRRFISAFCQNTKPGMLWDIGCNTGDYSETALNAGAKHVVGFDFDQGALERAAARARAKSLDLLPLYQDGANPSPDQGWRGSERRSAQRRGGADALIALAFEHHLAIGRNVPLDQLVDWLVSLAPKGIIEFVEKSDPTVQQLLALREDIFTDYSAGTFEAALKDKARIVSVEQVSRSGRTLYSYERL